MTGVEADFQALSFSDSAWRSAAVLTNAAALTGAAGSVMGTKRVDSLGTVRLRFGYQATPGVLIYATGGYAYGEVGFSASGAAVSFPLSFAAVSAANYAGGRGGFAAGGGLEYAITPNLIGRFEYLRYDLGTNVAADVLPHERRLAAMAGGRAAGRGELQRQCRARGPELPLHAGPARGRSCPSSPNIEACFAGIGASPSRLRRPARSKAAAVAT